MKGDWIKKIILFMLIVWLIIERHLAPTFTIRHGSGKYFCHRFYYAFIDEIKRMKKTSI
jgi:hypothetical protein